MYGAYIEGMPILWILKRKASISYMNLVWYLQLASALMLSGKTVDIGKKRGRPSSSSIDNNFEKKRKLELNTRPIPTKNIRLDQVGHHLVFRKQRGACKMPGCRGKTNHYCPKCEIHLCCNSQRNCNIMFHTKTNYFILHWCLCM